MENRIARKHGCATTYYGEPGFESRRPPLLSAPSLLRRRFVFQQGDIVSLQYVTAVLILAWKDVTAMSDAGICPRLRARPRVHVYWSIPNLFV